VKILAAVAAIVVALAVQTTLAGLFLGDAARLDVVLVVVVCVALSSGPIAGLVSGSVAGIVQDALSSGVLGIGGLAKTLAGFLAGVIGTQFIVTAPLPRFLVFIAATIVHAVVFMGLYVLLGLRDFGTPYSDVFGQALGNGFVGVVAFQVLEWFPGFAARRRMARAARR
jgi:rod shape-determining protein MreD